MVKDIFLGCRIKEDCSLYWVYILKKGKHELPLNENKIQNLLKIKQQTKRLLEWLLNRLELTSREQLQT